MNLDRVGPGENAPDYINVIVEIPSHSDPVKYEVDKKSGAMFVDRFMNTAMFYPCNYGYIPHSLSEDGDPVDVMVVAPYAVISGSVMRCRPVGMLDMTDESGRDTKILAVPDDKTCTRYRGVEEASELGEGRLNQLSHFFEHYKDLEQGKWVKVEGWLSAAEAKEEIIASISRYNTSPEKMYF